MTDEEFNRYCAEVMQIPRLESGNYKGWSPATDLNQMADVFDRLWHGILAEKMFIMPDIENNFVEDIAQKGIAQAMREFIESAKGESE